MLLFGFSLSQFITFTNLFLISTVIGTLLAIGFKHFNVPIDVESGIYFNDLEPGLQKSIFILIATSWWILVVINLLHMILTLVLPDQEE